MNGKYCECSNMDCPKDPDSGLLCGGKANLLHQNLKPIQTDLIFHGESLR